MEVNEAAAVCILEGCDDVGNIFSPVTLILVSQDLIPERYSLAESRKMILTQGICPELQSHQGTMCSSTEVQQPEASDVGRLSGQKMER